MRNTLTIRLPKDLAAWLDETSARTGVSQGQLVRRQLEKGRVADKGKPFMRLAGSVAGPKDLSRRKGFSRA